MFADRRDAGEQLAGLLSAYAPSDPVVLGIPRGGVVVAAPVAAALGAPLDVVVVRKLGVPGQPELAFGAIGEGGARVLNDDVVQRHRIDATVIARVEAAERIELDRRVAAYRAAIARVELEGRTALVVDDGVATGATARAACQVVRAQGALLVVMATPVAAPEATRAVAEVSDAVVAALTPARLGAVGAAYRDFRQTTDDEVIEALGSG